MASRKIEVEIVGDASSLKKAYGQASSAGGNLTRSLIKAGAIIGAAKVGFDALSFVVRAGASEFNQHAQVAAQTAAVLKSTGGAANVTAKHVDELANSILRKTGIDDEAVQSTENLLLSFTKIRNEAGRGNAIFDRATRLIEDYSVRTGKSATSAVTIFGKALNDIGEGKIPTTIRGIGKLNDGLVDQMKTMLKAGDVTGAQSLLLGQLEQRYGGAAEAAGKTLPGQINILKESFNNLAGDLFAKLVPSLTTAVQFLNNQALPAVSAFGEKVGDFLGPVLKNVAASVQASVTPVFKALGSFWQNDLLPIVRALGDIFQTTLQKVSSVVQSHMPQIKQILDNLGTVIQNLGKVILPILAFAFEQVLPRALAVAITILAKVTSVIAAISNAIPPVVKAVESGFQAIAGAIVKAAQAVKRAWDSVVGFIKGLPGMVYGLAMQIGQALVSGIVDGVAGLAESVKNKIVSGVHGAISGAKGLLGIHSPSTVTRDELGKPLGEGVVEGFLIGTATLPDKMSQKLQDAIERGRRVIESKRGVFETAFGRLSDRIFQAFDAETANHETPAEKLIKQIADRRQMEDLQRALDEAIASGDAKAIQRAQEDIQMVSLQRQADEERRNYESRRANLRQSLEDRLNLIQAHFDKEGGTVGELTKAITKLLNSYGVDFKTAGENLGNAFLQGLKGAIKTAAKGASAIESTIDMVAGSIRVGKIQGFATGGIVPGPLGAPQLVVAHGGETITPPGRGGGTGPDGDLILMVDGEVLGRIARRQILRTGAINVTAGLA